MKKLLSLILILTIIVSSQTIAFSDQVGIEYSSYLTNILNSVIPDEYSDWEETRANRAILAEVLMLDLIVCDDELKDEKLSGILNRYTQYKLEDSLFIRLGEKTDPRYGLDIPDIDDNQFLVYYDVKDNDAFYTIIPAMSKTQIKEALEEEKYSFWEFDEDSIEEAFDFICNVIDIIPDE